MSSLFVRLFIKDPENVKDPKVRAAYGKLCGVLGIFCNLLLVCGKFLAGLFSGSIAVMADAVNNLSDAAGSLITLVGFRLSQKPADSNHPFGHARFEYIAGLAVAVLVMVIGIELGKSSIDKILHPGEVSFGLLTFAILAGSILLKLWMAFFNRNIGRKIGSGTLEATYADSRNDVLATSAVLAAALVHHFTGLYLDGWMGLAVAVFILVNGCLLVRDTLNPLLGTAPDPSFVRYVEEKIESYPGVLGTHDLVVHDYGPGRRFASAHVEMSRHEDVMEAHDIIDNIEWDFLSEDKLHLIIHYDPIDSGQAELDPARSRAIKAIESIDPRLRLHDFRLIAGRRHDNYIFDVVVPSGFGHGPDELKRQIEAKLQNGPRPVHAHITVDDSYSPIPK
ncbi:cation diffusion facilitator family transporter [Ruminococcaceae bacterium OttesenSCG-928-I18]|nr:cation diffusion facilitator family transporter [Ruminococcaceae bacterium OttesenSCG-928-I18]